MDKSSSTVVTTRWTGDGTGPNRSGDKVQRMPARGTGQAQVTSPTGIASPRASYGFEQWKLEAFSFDGGSPKWCSDDACKDIFKFLSSRGLRFQTLVV